MEYHLRSSWPVIFHDRKEAGIRLGEYLRNYTHFKHPYVLGLPRGGVEIAAEVARGLNCPFNVVISRKIGAPGHSELGIGAISEDGEPYFNPGMSAYFDFESASVQATIEQETAELERRINLYRHGKRMPELSGLDVILTDDGLATGSTAVASGRYLRKLHPASLTLAVPIGPTDLDEEVKKTFDQVICLRAEDNLMSIGLWYESFNQVPDKEVLSLLVQADNR